MQKLLENLKDLGNPAMFAFLYWDFSCPRLTFSKKLYMLKDFYNRKRKNI